MSENEKIKPIDPYKTKAILIGVSEFEDKSFVNAPPIKNNVEKLAAILQDENILGLPENRILLLNKNESHDVILRKIREFIGYKSDVFADTVIFYFAGHGYKTDNDEFFLVTKNTDKEDIDITSIPWKKIKDILEKGNSIQQRFYILDACHSGAAALGENDTETDIAEGSLLIAAAKANKKSYFNSTDQYTHFTNALINILENGIDKTDAQQIDTELLFNNLDKLLRDKKFEITKKTTHKIENVSFFKNVKFDNEIEKIRKIEEQIEKATNFIFEKQYTTARLILKGLQSEVETLKNKERLLKTINRKIEDCKFLPRYHKEIEIYFKKLIKQKETQISQLSDNLKNDKSTIAKLEKQLQETEKQLAENKENADEIKQLTTQKEKLQKQLESEIQKFKIQTVKAFDLQTQLNTLQDENKELKKQTNFEIEILEQVQKFVEKKKGNWEYRDWVNFSNPLVRKYQLKDDKLLGELFKREQKVFLHKIKIEQKVKDLTNTIKQDQVIYNKLKSEKETLEKELKNLKNPLKPKPQPIVTGKNFTQKVGNTTFGMIFVKGGRFQQESRKVTLSDFYIGKFPVTQKLYQAIMGNNPSEFKEENNPVDRVSWYDAIEFCNKLSEKAGKQPYYNIDKNKKDPNNKNSSDDIKWTVTTNKDAKGYRLLTEAEWEYAARGGVETHGRASHEYAGSNKIDEVAWYDKNSGNNTHPVGEKKSNELGIYDMSGNVFEWCHDWYDDYEKDETENPQGTETNSSRVIRGGSWSNSDDYLRVEQRIINRASYLITNIGFRIALSL